MADSRPPEELYDVLSDPHEVRNLATSPAFQDTLAHYRQVMDQWLHEADHGVYPEPADEIVHAEEMMRGQFEKQMAKKGLDMTATDEAFLAYWKSMLLE